MGGRQHAGLAGSKREGSAQHRSIRYEANLYMESKEADLSPEVWIVFSYSRPCSSAFAVSGRVAKVIGCCEAPG